MSDNGLPMKNTCRFERSVQHSLRNGCLMMMVALEESLAPQVDVTDVASRASVVAIANVLAKRSLWQSTGPTSSATSSAAAVSSRGIRC